MAASYFQSINNRNLEVVKNSEDIKIFKWNRNSYTDELGEALDQLYLERFLNDGQCTVCGVETTKFCISCYTHYCGTDCQRTDWPKHKSVCEKSRLSTQFDSCASCHITENSVGSICFESKHQRICKRKINNEKKEDKEFKSDERFSHIGENSGICKEMKNELISTLETSLEDNSENSSNGKEKDTDLDDELIINSQYDVRCERNNKEERSDRAETEQTLEGIDIHENEETNISKYELSFQKQRQGGKTELIYHKNSFSIGDVIEVVIMNNSQDKNGNKWVIQKKNMDALEIIKKLLLENPESYSQNTNISCYREIVQMMYNGEPIRAKIICFKPKLLVQCVDTGIRFHPRFARYKHLPDYLKSIKRLAFPIKLEESKMPEINSPTELMVQVVDITPNGVFNVELLKGNNNVNFRSKLNGRNESNLEIIPNNCDNENLRRSVLDELEVGQYGIFTSCEVHIEKIFGSLVPDSANYCQKKLMSLYCMEADIIEAEVGDLVLVPNKENLGQRGIVILKSENYGYKVRLIDYGHTVTIFKVYKAPEKARDIMELGCVFSTVNLSDMKNFEVNRPYFFEIIKRIAGDKWFCSLKTDSSCPKIFAEGYLEKTENFLLPEMKYIPFESGCTVIISALDKDSAENALYVQRVDLDWEKNLQKLISEINSFSESFAEDFFDSVKVGDLVASKYSEDGIFYRAKVLTKFADTACVFYVDYGNKEITRSTDLRSLPSFLKEKPAFALRVKLAGSLGSFTDDNLNYLQKFVDENQHFIMTYDGDISNGIILNMKDSVNINQEVFAQMREPIEANHSEPKSSDPFAKKFLERRCFQEGPVNCFIILNLDDKEFMEKGQFWASNLYDDNFIDIVLSHDISIYCENNKEKYIPSIGELCFALYEDDWYRGLVLEQAASNYKVFFIDFGNSCLVPSGAIRKMVPKYFETPPLAVQCYLNGFEDIPKEKIKSICIGLKGKINEFLNDVTIEKVVKNSCYVRIPDRILYS